MRRSENEFPELEAWSSRGQKNSFYVDMEQIKESHGSSNVLGSLDQYTYRLDSRSHNVIRTKINNRSDSCHA